LKETICTGYFEITFSWNDAQRGSFSLYHLMALWKLFTCT